MGSGPARRPATPRRPRARRRTPPPRAEPRRSMKRKRKKRRKRRRRKRRRNKQFLHYTCDIYNHKRPKTHYAGVANISSPSPMIEITEDAMKVVTVTVVLDTLHTFRIHDKQNI